ncbi:MAG TPA: response regulator [Anaerolineales bacterium]|nr:response regulator [Anaerolineales bacterium]
MDTQSGYLLVVEDIPDILKLLDATLKFKGYRVLTARNGEEALEVIQKERPLIVITDILMPKMDGFSLVHTLRIHSETRSIPVIFLSATYVAPEDKAFALNIGATRFIEKPIDLELFMKTISELLLQGAPATQEPLTEPDFYIGYRKRLKTKLNQKMTQIARTERLLETLPEEEKPSFQASLQMAISEREEIEKLLDQIREHFETK